MSCAFPPRPSCRYAFVHERKAKFNLAGNPAHSDQKLIFLVGLQDYLGRGSVKKGCVVVLLLQDGSVIVLVVIPQIIKDEGSRRQCECLHCVVFFLVIVVMVILGL